MVIKILGNGEIEVESEEILEERVIVKKISPKAGLNMALCNLIRSYEEYGRADLLCLAGIRQKRAGYIREIIECLDEL